MCVEIDKCRVDAKEVPFLWIMVSGSGLWMNPDKANAIVDWPRPSNVKEVQQLLGLWNFYRRLIPGYAAIVPPNTDILRSKSKEITSGDAQEAAFLNITVLFSTRKPPILRH